MSVPRENAIQQNTYPKIQHFEKRFTIPVNLHSQLTSWCHDDGHWAFHLFKWPLILNVTKYRKKERNGLPRARLGNANDVAARHNGRNGLSLNGCWSRVVQSLYDI